MIGFNAIPKVAVVPILVLWFGIGFMPAVLTAFLISFFPIVVNVATGLATIEPELEDVLKALGASKLDIMRKVGIPRSLPYFFGSLKVAITLAFVGSVISESVASNNGIGNLMLQAQAQFQVPLIFAGLVALAVEGIVMYWLMAVLEAAHDRLGAALGLRAGLRRSRASQDQIGRRLWLMASGLIAPVGLTGRSAAASISATCSRSSGSAPART